jgi:excisionase family DNA binding protein
MTQPEHIPAARTDHPLPEHFISKAEVARRLGKRVRTIDNWMRQGLLPYYKINHSVCFKWSEVERHLEQLCRVCPTDED